MSIQHWIKNVTSAKKPADNTKYREVHLADNDKPSRMYIGTQWKIAKYDLRDILKKFKKIVPLLLFISAGTTTTEKTGRIQIIPKLTATRTENTVMLTSGQFGLEYSEIGTFGRVSQIKLYYSNEIIYDQNTQGYKTWPGDGAIRDTPLFIASLANIAAEFEERAEFIEDMAKQRAKDLGVKIKK